MDIKSWILLVGTTLIIAVICHGFWTAYRARKNGVRVDLEKDVPEYDLDDLVMQSGELPNGGARVTPTVGYDVLLVKDRLLNDGLLDSGVVADPASGVSGVTDEGDVDAGYHPEQATLDLENLADEMNALEERYAARAASGKPAVNAQSRATQTPKLPESTEEVGTAELATEDTSAPLPPKKLIARDIAVAPRKQFEPPFPDEVEIARQAEQKRAAELEKLQAEELRRAEQAAREAEYKANVEAQRIRKEEQKQREAQAKIDAQARAKSRALAKEEAAQRAQQRTADTPVSNPISTSIPTPGQAVHAEPQQLSLSSEPVVEFPDTAGQNNNQPPVEELVVLNVIAKSRPFQGRDVLELFLRNGIKFGDMNIFHRINPVTKDSQYSIASVTEPGFFDLRTMETLEFRGLCFFMQLPCSGQATKVFTDMLTVADKLARLLEAEVCDEQFNRLTRQSTEHYRQRVAEFTRRHMSKRAL